LIQETSRRRSAPAFRGREERRKVMGKISSHGTALPNLVFGHKLFIMFGV
jgi:hypothetical protein